MVVVLCGLFLEATTFILCFCFHDFSDRVALGRALDLPVYFGDAGSREVKQALELCMRVVTSQFDVL